MQQSLNKKISGVYAITPDEPVNFTLVEKVIIKYEINIIQYRRKTTDEKVKYTEAKKLQQLCTLHNTLFIINDDINLTEKIGADGVHLGKSDGSVVNARERLGEKAIIGASCYNDIGLAIRAEQCGASYVAFGSLFSSNTKPNAQHCSLDVITKARQLLSIPIVGIGGIDFKNSNKVFDAGCNAAAMLSYLFK
jgi:thiamine-phosphate pyrophosphorylase